MKKLYEQTYGTSIFMRIELNGEIQEISCYLRNDGEHYKTTADGTEKRKAVIDAFNKLY